MLDFGVTNKYNSYRSLNLNQNSPNERGQKINNISIMNAHDFKF